VLRYPYAAKSRCAMCARGPCSQVITSSVFLSSGKRAIFSKIFRAGALAVPLPTTHLPGMRCAVKEAVPACSHSWAALPALALYSTTGSSRSRTCLLADSHNHHAL
jgi:hypothetical protein